jgi:serine/threonine protein phosphatase 1
MPRTIAIGDIHGYLGALTALVEFAGVRADDRLVTLGDYVDRGPDSAGVLDWLIEWFEAGQLVPLLGNHDQMMQWARETGTFMWEECGGTATLDSYRRRTAGDGLDCVPDAHWRFLDDSCKRSYETQSHIFTHASPDADVPIHEQTDGTLLWQSWNDPARHMSGKLMVCGHTAQRSGWPLANGNAICIDTRVYDSGWLTALDVDSGEFWQARENGETRRGWLDEVPP